MTTATRGRRTRTGDLDEPLRAVIYVRQSAAKEETISLEEQEHACREYCATKGYRVVDVAIEQITGRLWSRRPEMQRAMRLIEDGTANVLVIRKWNRISRRNLHWFQAEYQVEQAGGRIESALEQVDATTAVGRFARNSMINAGELQSELIADEWRATHAHRRRAGLPPTGGRKYGYRRGRAGGPGGHRRRSKGSSTAASRRVCWRSDGPAPTTPAAQCGSPGPNANGSTARTNPSSTRPHGRRTARPAPPDRAMRPEPGRLHIPCLGFWCAGTAERA
jgi:DNA invertase Pin-like site-specific DNA recombinase